MPYIFLIFTAGCLLVFCAYRAVKLDYITVFSLRDTLYIMELQKIAGTLSSREVLDRTQMAVQKESRKCVLYYAAVFLLLFLILFCFLGLVLQKY